MSTELRLQIARDLRAIEELWGDLPEEAANRSDDKMFPGGDALVMLAPAANLEAWEHGYENVEREGGDTAYIYDQAAELHPLLVLATWEDAIRDERNQPTDLRATIGRAADYIRNSLDWALSSDETGNVNFLGVDQLSIDLKRCRAMLENLLHDGVRAEFARVTCTVPSCDEKPRLMKVYADDAAKDHHKCPACKAEYDYDAFVAAAKVHAFSEAADKTWMTVADAAFSISRPVNTLRTWIKAEKISTQQAPGVPTTVYVFWPDVRDVHKEARVVEARRKAKKIA